MALRCVICQSPGCDLDHIKTRGSGGTDEDWNLWALCRNCHQARHRMGIGTFVSKYPQAERYLFVRGWEVKIENGVKKLRRC